VVDGEDEDPVAVALQRFAGAHLDELQRIGEPPEDPPETPEQVAEARRAVDGQGNISLAERERLQHSREAEVVVGVKVGQEDLLEVGQADRRAHQLPLRAFRAVEEEPFAAAAE